MFRKNCQIILENGQLLNGIPCSHQVLLLVRHYILFIIIMQSIRLAITLIPIIFEN